MGENGPGKFRYELSFCRLRHEQVWAICTPQPDGTWCAVNCLDKHQPCSEQRCAFTTDHGVWPFAVPK